MIFTFSPAALRLNAAFAAHGFTLYLVGGAVRDTLLGIEPKDFDFSTSATPDEQVVVYRDAGFRFVPTGIDHGTLTAIVDDELFEVTTMRTESEHDGRYARMTFTRDLNDDLGRRDLTINAMAMDFDGNIIDPYNGRQDLEDGRIRFVGNPGDRIREDYLRILRWVRFHQRLANGQPFDPETLIAVKANVESLRRISVERVWAEMSKALTYDNADAMLDMLVGSGIARNIGLEAGWSATVWSLKDRTRDPVSRLVAYYRGTDLVNRVADAWKWSNEARLQAKAMNRMLADKVLDEQGQRFMVAVDGQDPYHVAEAARLDNYETDIENWDVPVFPVSGDDLIKRGIKPGPVMGKIIRDIKVAWAETNYTATKADLLAGY
jgi:tRNA nucleotidyltransferase (CCA-adding enzyme)